MSPDDLFMTRALGLARLGMGNVAPNPMVGCVIVHDGKIIGEGWHARFGEAHAEVNAVKSVTDKSLLKDSAVYVNLEPCSHFGKTPPCADMLVREGVKRVVISTLDTNPMVAGGGVKKLREGGIEVATGILHKEGRELNKRFFTRIELRRPFVLLKWAQTADGFMTGDDPAVRWISNVYSRQLVHRWRSEEDAILVGSQTVRVDNPRLNVRDWSGRNPVRIVIDRNLTLEKGLHVFDGSQTTICYNSVRSEEAPNLTLVKLREEVFLKELLADLSRRNIQSVMVEGGPKTLELFINSGYWDEARVFQGSASWGKGHAAPLLRGTLESRENVMGDWLSVYKNESELGFVGLLGFVGFVLSLSNVSDLLCDLCASA